MLPRNNKWNRGRGRAQIRQWTLKSDVKSFGEGVGRVSPNIRFGETSKLARLTRLTHLDSASRLRTLDGGVFEIDIQVSVMGSHPFILFKEYTYTVQYTYTLANVDINKNKKLEE